MTPSDRPGGAYLRSVRCGLGVVALWAAATPDLAGQAISADRPGLDFSPFTVSPGTIQLEVGLPALAYDAEGDESAWLIQSPTLVRIGLAPDIELRVGVSPFNSVSFDPGGTAETVTDRGFGDLEVGAKLQLSDADGAGPWFALIPSITLPTGEEPFTSDGVGYLLNAVASFPVAGGTGLAAVAGLYATQGGGDEYDVSGLAALVGSRSLSDAVTGFLEVGVLPTEGGDTPVLVGGGFAFLLSDEVQVDLYVDRGVGSAATDWQFGGGVAVRF